MGALRSCYETALALCIKHNIRSIAFPCISTGIFGFSKKIAAPLALDTVHKWLLWAERTKYSEYVKPTGKEQDAAEEMDQDKDAEQDEDDKVKEFLEEEVEDGNEE